MKQPITATKTLFLRYPVTIGKGRGSVVYRKLELRCPTLKEFARMKTEPEGIEGAITSLAIIAGVPQNVIERLGPRDFYEACTFVGQWDEEDHG